MIWQVLLLAHAPSLCWVRLAPSVFLFLGLLTTGSVREFGNCAVSRLRGAWRPDALIAGVCFCM
jgi:hypothetical protein